MYYMERFDHSPVIYRPRVNKEFVVYNFKRNKILLFLENFKIKKIGWEIRIRKL